MTLFLGIENITAFLESLDPEERAAILELDVYVHHEDGWGRPQAWWQSTRFSWDEAFLAGIMFALVLTNHRFSWAIEFLARYIMLNV
jgi:hypothetical protein